MKIANTETKLGLCDEAGEKTETCLWCVTQNHMHILQKGGKWVVGPRLPLATCLSPLPNPVCFAASPSL